MIPSFCIFYCLTKDFCTVLIYCFCTFIHILLCYYWFEKMLPSLGVPSLEKLGNEHYIEVDNVRISPRELIFPDAFECREYCETITIQNCGVKAAFIRILQPTSYAFKIQTLINGAYLSPGLSLKRKVRFKYLQSNPVTVANLPLIINKTEVDFKFKITFSVVSIKVIPELLDFGIINVEESGPVMPIVIKNEGTKGTYYVVDVMTTSNDYQITCHPLKGFIGAGQQLPVNIQIIPYIVGEYVKEIWINSASPVRISLKWTVAKQEFLVHHPLKTSQFILLDFSYTYLGTCREQFIVLNNSNMSQAMYCILGEWKNQLRNIQDTLNQDSNLKHFSVSAKEGILMPQEKRIISFKFNPKYSLDFDHDVENYRSYMGVLQIVKLDYREVLSYDQQPENQHKDFSDESVSSIITTGQRRSSAVSYSEKSSNTFIIDSIDEVSMDALGFDNFVRVIVHGVAEKPNVSVNPDSLWISPDIKLKCKEERVLKIVNNSKHLSITFQYMKIPFVDIKPSVKEIRPQEAFEALIVLRPLKLGAERTEITLNLMHKTCQNGGMYNVGKVSVPLVYRCHMDKKITEPIFVMGITPMLVNEVGSFVNNVKFNTSVDVPRAAIVDKYVLARNDQNALIAFPNDRVRSLRPWTSKTDIRTIFTGVSRFADSGNTLQTFEVLMRNRNNEYYIKYLRSKGKDRELKLPKIRSDYDLSDPSLLLAEKFPIKRCRYFTPSRHMPKFVPLVPLQLYYITIYPKKISVGKIAQFDEVSEKVSVRNDNEFPIDVYVRPVNYTGYNLTFPLGNRITIEEHNKEDFPFCLIMCQPEGFVDIALEVVINDSDSYIVNVMGKITEKCVVVFQNLIEFEVGESLKYLTVSNPYSTCVSFYFECPPSPFSIYPSEGRIEPKKHVMCMVTYKPHGELSNTAEFLLHSEGKASTTVYISAKEEDLDVSFQPSEIKFGDVPVNTEVMQYSLLVNTNQRAVDVEIVNPAPYKGVHVIQQDAVLNSNSRMKIYIRGIFTQCGKFSFNVEINIQRGIKNLRLKVSGNVIFPLISIKPNPLLFRKILNFSFDRLLFLIENKSTVDACVGFNMASYKEFLITTSEGPEDVFDGAKLKPGESKQLCMHYNPVDVSIQSFDLPIIINGVADTSSITDFSKSASVPNMVSRLLPMQKINVKLPVVNVLSNANNVGITFSKTNFSFRYYPNPEFDTFTKEEFIIYNEGSQLEEFCIRWDEVQPPFFFTAIDDCQQGNCSYSKILNPGEYVTFEFQFQPENPCYSKCKLNVYVRDRMDGAVFKFIYIEGFFPSPSLEVSCNTIYLEPVPLKTFSETQITLTAMYHVLVCSFKAQAEDSDVEIYKESPSVIDPRKIKNSFQLRVQFSTCSSKVLNTTAVVACQCGAKCTFRIMACSENCNLTNHAFLKLFCEERTKFPETWETLDLESMSVSDVSSIVEVAVNHNETSYPYFPIDDDSEYSRHMKQVITTLEKWVHTFGFYAVSYYTVPEGFLVDPLRDKQTTKKPNKAHPLPYIQLLINLGGGEVLKQFPNNDKQWGDNDISAVYRMVQIYKMALQLISKEGGLLPNVEPEYLLTFSQYELYQTHILPENTKEKSFGTFPRDRFDALKKQCWVDLLLQTFKVFNVTRENNLIQQNRKIPSPVLSRYTTKSMDMILESCTYDYVNSLYHPVENMLLYWLETVYNVKRHIFETAECSLHEKTVKLFDEDLKDGTILGVVTAAYCPYLRDEFNHFYWTPKKDIELLYNACKLCMVWDKMFCQFKMKPLDIVNSNSLDMMMFVLNLFDLLPSMYHSETINMKASLARSFEKTISIANQNSFPIKFTFHFFHNDHKSFSTNISELIIAPKQSGSVSIVFCARILATVEAVILFCGENQGYHMAKNQVYNLMGIGEAYPWETFNLKCNLYEAETITLDIKSPYKVSAKYQIQEIDDITNFKSSTLQYQDNQTQYHYPRKITIMNKELTCNDTGCSKLTIMKAAMTVYNFDLWICFKNDEVGDFMILLKCVTKDKTLQTNVVKIGISYTKLLSDCICSGDFRMECPKTIKIPLITQNKVARKCMLDCMLASIESDEDKEFWKHHMRTYVGIAVIRRVTNDCEGDNILPTPNEYLDYEVNLEGNYENLQFQKSVRMHYLEKAHEDFYIHINSKDLPGALHLVFLNKAYGYKRKYKVLFEKCN